MLSAGMYSAGEGDIGATTPPPAASGDAGGMDGMASSGSCQIAMFASQVVSSVGSMVTGIMNYGTQKYLLDKQEDMAVARFDHQDDMAKLNKEMQYQSLEGQEKKIKYQVQDQKKYLAAVRGRKKAEGQLTVAEEKKTQMELTEKTGSMDKKTLNSIFNSHFYGNPTLKQSNGSNGKYA